MNCGQCGKPGDDGAAFCTGCGSVLGSVGSGSATSARDDERVAGSLSAQGTTEVRELGAENQSRFCRSCGRSLLPGSAFCTGCGRSLTAEDLIGPGSAARVKSGTGADSQPETGEPHKTGFTQVEDADPGEVTADGGEVLPARDPQVTPVSSTSACPECGTRLEPGALHCIQCGVAVGATSSAAMTVSQHTTVPGGSPDEAPGGGSPPAAPEGSSSSSRMHRSRMLVAGLVALFVLVAVSTGAVAWSQRGSEQDPATEIAANAADSSTTSEAAEAPARVTTSLPRVTTTVPPTTVTTTPPTTSTTAAPVAVSADEAVEEALSATAECLLHGDATATSVPDRVRFAPGTDFADLVVSLPSSERTYVLGASEGQRFWISAISQEPVRFLVCLSGSQRYFVQGQWLTAASSDFQLVSDLLPATQDYYLTVVPLESAGVSELTIRVHIPPKE